MEIRDGEPRSDAQDTRSVSAAAVAVLLFLAAVACLIGAWNSVYTTLTMYGNEHPYVADKLERVLVYMNTAGCLTLIAVSVFTGRRFLSRWKRP